jgi:hypothetical protein
MTEDQMRGAFRRARDNNNQVMAGTGRFPSIS